MNTEDSEFERIEREQAMRGVPDAIHHTDTSEPLMYIQGWNDCRQAMLAEQPAQQEPVYHPRQYGDVTGTKEVRTLQAERTWVGLTDEEITHIVDSEWEEAFVRMIEAKLKEKNT